ncbi:S1C family serine protease [Lacunimicrobium album]
MKTLVTNLACAFIGGLVAVWASGGMEHSRPTAEAALLQTQLPPLPTLPPLGTPTPRNEQFASPPLQQVVEELTQEEAINISVYENVNQSVVNITTKAVQSGGIFMMELNSEGSGSGSILDKEGHILTNYHVVENAQQVNVTLYNGASYEASFVGADPINDIAIIKIKAPQEELIPVILGDSSKLRVGMKIFALGNPFGFERTLTTGIISSLNRSLAIYGSRTIKSIIQIDAAVNPGNSGGPLLDTHSRLIGMNTAIATRSGQSSGVGFAIPASLIKRVVPQLIAHGKVIRPESGISAVFQTEKGLVVARVLPNSPAEKAGLRGPVVTRTRRGVFTVEKEDRTKADKILEVNGNKVKTADDFLSEVEAKSPGDTIILTIERDGRRQQLQLSLTSSEPAIEGTPVR